MIDENFAPHSRFEMYMKNAILKKGIEGLPKPLSRGDELLLELCEVISNGEGGGSSNESIVDITLTVDGWVESVDATYYTQNVTIPNVTANTMIDLHPSPEQLMTIINSGITMFAANDNGNIKVYSVNGKPNTEMIIRMTMKEVIA